MTTDSPSTVGRVATRMSSMRPAAAVFSEMRPSCGFRRSAMSSFASTFRRVVTPAIIRFGIRCTSCSTPSMRSRTASVSSCGSKWMSLAPSSAAWKMIELTRRTSGASEMPSSTSRSDSSSFSSSRSASSASTIARAPKASDARPSRRSSVAISSREATASSTWNFVPRRSSSIAWTLVGSATATRRMFPPARTGRRSRARARAAGAAGRCWRRRRRPGARRKADGSGWRGSRAMPSGDATFSSRTAWANEPPCLTRPRTSASLSRRDQSGRLDQVGDELGELVDLKGGQAGSTGSLCRSGLARCAQLGEIHTSNEVSAKRLLKLSQQALESA